MLIKDHEGDWGILLGKWEGFKKGIPGKAGRKKILDFLDSFNYILNVTLTLFIT